MMSVLMNKDDKNVLYSKGAYEVLIDKCLYINKDNKSGIVAGGNSTFFMSKNFYFQIILTMI
jgi:hypothetical protein